MQDFHFVMKVNKASPKLFLACAEGEHIKKAVLTCRKAGKEQQEFLKVTMSRPAGLVLPDQRQLARRRGPDRQVSLNFAKIEFEYKDQKADGRWAAPSTPAGT